MSLYTASVPVFSHYLDSLSGILAKAEAHAAERKIAPEVLLRLRLAPDMFALSRQVQVASDFAKNTAGRLAAVEVPKFPDEEKTFAELQERIARTKAYVTGISASAFEGAETRVISFPIGGKLHEMDGADFLYHFALPNFYFHLTAVYAILRANGVALGKGDFIGSRERLRPV